MGVRAFAQRGPLVRAVVVSAASAMASCAPLPSDDCSVLHECPTPEGGADAIGQDRAMGRDAEIQGIDADGGIDQWSGDAGPGADAPPDAVRESAACDPTKSPHDDPCVIGEPFGVFVSPVGADGNPGTRALPLHTLGQAMDVAQSSGKHRVYACAGTFAEPLVVGASRDGVAVYGGLDCTSWNYGSQSRVTVAPDRPGYALDIEGVAQGVTFEDIDFVAASASGTNPGESSIAAFVSKSQNVAFHRVSITAGNAAEGAAGASGGPPPDGGPAGGSTNWLGAPPYAELHGNDAIGAVGAAEKTCKCPDSTLSVGGSGGGSSDGGALPPGAGSPVYEADAGAGWVGRNGASCGAGGVPAQIGSDARSTMAGAPSQSWGSVVPTGWTPAASVPGLNGLPGQGGGGGGNGLGGVGGGGSGACGGCGGAGGKPGGPGGSSFALLSSQSTIELVACTLVASSAGAGGAGGQGEPGQPGSPVAGNGGQGGCQGATGGSGAGGNGGQGGAGGVSIGIGYAGSPPTFDGAPVAPAASLAGVTVGAWGPGGRKGAAGAAAMTSVGQPQPGADGAPGFSGVAQAVLGF